MITNIKNEDKNKVLGELQTLAKLLQDKQSELGTNPRQAKLGDAVVFASDRFHAGAAPFVNEDAGDKFEDYPRVMSYMEFAPKVVVEEKKWWPLLKTLYNSEEVFDRRSMVDPRMLLNMMELHGEDPLVVQQARRWLNTITVDSEWPTRMCYECDNQAEGV